MNSELEKKVEQAVKLLQVCYKAAGEPLEKPRPKQLSLFGVE